MIRLQRVGRKNDPSFRVVLTDSKNGPRSGRYLEILGAYDARKGKAQLVKDRITHWMSVGAKPSGTLHNLLVSHKVLKSKKINVLPQIKKVEAVKEAKAEVKPEVKAEAPVEATA
ncbi:MAG: 30S ribosomal protein S16 [bacterium]|nr:30S ribosomal protein S16 [bacterium]